MVRKRWKSARSLRCQLLQLSPIESDTRVCLPNVAVCVEFGRFEMVRLSHVDPDCANSSTRCAVLAGAALPCRGRCDCLAVGCSCWGLAGAEPCRSCRAGSCGFGLVGCDRASAAGAVSQRALSIHDLVVRAGADGAAGCRLRAETDAPNRLAHPRWQRSFLAGTPPKAQANTHQHVKRRSPPR